MDRTNIAKYGKPAECDINSVTFSINLYKDDHSKDIAKYVNKNIIINELINLSDIVEKYADEVKRLKDNNNYYKHVNDNIHNIYNKDIDGYIIKLDKANELIREAKVAVTALTVMVLILIVLLWI